MKRDLKQGKKRTFPKEEVEPVDRTGKGGL